MPPLDQDRTLAERMRHALPAMSPGERRLVRLCLSFVAPDQLATVSALAEAAGVSSPTVLRCLSKIGFEHFSAFRAAALAELAAKHESTLAQIGRRSPDQDAALGLAGKRSDLVEGVASTFERLDWSEFDAAVDLIADAQRRQLFTGGRFSHSVAELLHAHVHLMRPGCDLVTANQHGRPGQLIDIGRTHVLTVFDFRRYQRDTVELARLAKRKRAKVVLVTDQWMSPIADWADAVLVAEVRSASPFDSLVPALALVEALIDAVHLRIPEAARLRLAQFESDTENFEWNRLSDLPAFAERAFNHDGA